MTQTTLSVQRESTTAPIRDSEAYPVDRFQRIKSPGETVKFTWTFTTEQGVSVVGATVTEVDPLTGSPATSPVLTLVGNVAFGEVLSEWSVQAVTAALAGGVAGAKYYMLCRATFSDGTIQERTGIVQVERR
jgi:hypothetical protein